MDKGKALTLAMREKVLKAARDRVGNITIPQKRIWKDPEERSLRFPEKRPWA